MSGLKKWLLEEESGQGLVEYALIIALVAIATIGALTGLAGVIEEKFNTIAFSL